VAKSELQITDLKKDLHKEWEGGLKELSERFPQMCNQKEQTEAFVNTERESVRRTYRIYIVEKGGVMYLKRNKIFVLLLFLLSFGNVAQANEVDISWSKVLWDGGDTVGLSVVIKNNNCDDVYVSNFFEVCNLEKKEKSGIINLIHIDGCTLDFPEGYRLVLPGEVIVLTFLFQEKSHCDLIKAGVRISMILNIQKSEWESHKKLKISFDSISSIADRLAF